MVRLPQHVLACRPCGLRWRRLLDRLAARAWHPRWWFAWLLLVTPASAALSTVPEVIQFTGVQGGPRPPAQTVTITGGTWSSFDTCPWVDAIPTSGPSGGSHTLTPSPGWDALPVGTATCPITYSAPGQPNLVQTMTAVKTGGTVPLGVTALIVTPRRVLTVAWQHAGHGEQGSWTCAGEGSPQTCTCSLVPGAYTCTAVSGGWSCTHPQGTPNACGSTLAESFRLDRRLGTTQPFGELVTLPGDARTYRDLTTTAGSLYCYRLQARNSAGLSPFTPEACEVSP